MLFLTAIFGHLTSLLKKPMPFLWSVYPWLQSEMFLSNSVDMMKNLSSAAKEGKKLQVTSQKIQIRILIKQEQNNKIYFVRRWNVLIGITTISTFKVRTLILRSTQKFEQSSSCFGHLLSKCYRYENRFHNMYEK